MDREERGEDPAPRSNRLSSQLSLYLGPPFGEVGRDLMSHNNGVSAEPGFFPSLSTPASFNKTLQSCALSLCFSTFFRAIPSKTRRSEHNQVRETPFG